MTTNQVKFEDTDNNLTAYCSDDTGDTEIGPAKWDDGNNKLEINCDSTDYQVKWDDATNKLEVRNVSDRCCWIDGPCCGDDCDTMPQFLKITFADIINCEIVGDGDCTDLNGNTYILEWISTCVWITNSGLPTGIDSIIIRTDGGGCFGGDRNWQVQMAGDACFTGRTICLSNSNCNLCDELPKTANNEFDEENCIVNESAAGYDGTAVVDIA